MLPLLSRVDQGVMAIKEYSAFLRAPALLKPHHQTLIGGVLPLCRDAVVVFYSPNQPGPDTIMAWIGVDCTFAIETFF